MRVDLPALLHTKDMRLSDLARRLGVHKSMVTRWAQKHIPPARVVDIEKATGIPREMLRPDIFRGRQ